MSVRLPAHWLWQEQSLCYQTLPFLMEHKLGGSKAILVVSPLVALMEDQVYILKKHGVESFNLSFFHFCGQGKHCYS